MNQVKRRRNGYLKRKEEAIRVQMGWSWFKRLFLLGFVLLFVLMMLVILWMTSSPKDWQEDTVLFSRMSQQRVRNSTQHFLHSMDGRVFLLPDAAEHAPKLSVGESCRIVYSDDFFRAKCVESLITEEDGVMVALEERVARHEKDVRDCWLLIAGAFGVYAVYLALMECFGCRKEKARIRALREEMALRASGRQ